MGVKAIAFLFFFAALFIVSQSQSQSQSQSESESQANSITTPQPQEFKSFKIGSTNAKAQTASGCKYTVTISTSCSSPSYTRDQISLSFGDAYGNQVYAPRIDNPSSRAFERCSTDTFYINGPCLYPICYLYLYRTGYDGWKPDTVKVYTHNYKAVSFYFNSFIPNGVWFGFNFCRNGNSAAMVSTM